MLRFIGKAALLCLMILFVCQPVSPYPRPYRHAHHQIQPCLMEQVRTFVNNYFELCKDYPDANKILKGIPFKSLCPADQEYLQRNALNSTNELYARCCHVSLHTSSSCSKQEWRKVLLARFLEVLRIHMSG